jgi:hypothetical protein
LISGELAAAPAPENRVRLNRSAYGEIAEEEFQALQVGASVAYFYNQIRRLGDGLEPEADVDWNETLARHERLEEQSNEIYRRANAAH